MLSPRTRTGLESSLVTYLYELHHHLEGSPRHALSRVDGKDQGITKTTSPGTQDIIICFLTVQTTISVKVYPES